MTAAALPAEVRRTHHVRRVLRTVLGINLGLVAIKAAVGWYAGSLAVIGGAIDSGVDTVTTVVALALAHVAGQAPDERHPYGHAKFETLGALSIVAFLSITVFELVQQAVAQIRRGEAAVENTGMAIVVMAVSLVVGLATSRYEARRGRALESGLLLADAAHLRADVYVTVAVLAGLLLVRAGVPTADAWTTLAVAGLVASTGWEIIRDAVPVLVDEAAAEADEIRRVALGLHGVHEVYDVRSRGRPGEVFAELTIAVTGRMDVEAAHAIADLVESAVSRHLGARGVVVHVEPLRAAAQPNHP